MVFPSTTLRTWCESIRELVDAPRKNRIVHSDALSQSEIDEGNTLVPPELCQCEVDEMIMYAPPHRRAQLASGLFWSVWIDQVLRGLLAGRWPGMYLNFARRYPFPILYSHPTPGDASPYFIISGEHPYPLPSTELLFEDLSDFWVEVREWLTETAGPVMSQAAEAAFKRDMKERFPPECPDFFSNELQLIYLG